MPESLADGAHRPGNKSTGQLHQATAACRRRCPLADQLHDWPLCQQGPGSGCLQSSGCLQAVVQLVGQAPMCAVMFQHRGWQGGCRTAGRRRRRLLRRLLLGPAGQGLGQQICGACKLVLKKTCLECAPSRAAGSASASEASSDGAAHMAAGRPGMARRAPHLRPELSTSNSRERLRWAGSAAASSEARRPSLAAACKSMAPSHRRPSARICGPAPRRPQPLA